MFSAGPLALGGRGGTRGREIGIYLFVEIMNTIAASEATFPHECPAKRISSCQAARFGAEHW